MLDKPKIGAHVSIAGGLFNCVENAKVIGAEIVQIFGSSPRQWHTRFPSKEEISEYQDKLKGSDLRGVYLHGAYLVNLASPDSTTLAKSIKNLSEHLQIAEMINAEGLIFHVGSGRPGAGIVPAFGDLSQKSEGLKQAIKAMKKVIQLIPGRSQLIMENSASGKKVGAWPEEMKIMLEGIGSDRAKICLDMAHSFESGLIEKYDPENIKIFLDRWDKEVGLENVVALHVNDSKTIGGSHNDRHENIGEGHIGLGGFKNLAKEKRLWDKPWILEVPGFEDMGPDKKNVDILKSLFN